MKTAKQNNIISPTGCVHREDDNDINVVEKGRTLCNHNNYHLAYGRGFYHDWPHTDKPVTCIRCLNKLNGEKATEHLPLHISINENKEVVIIVQDDVENIALWTDQDNYTIYFKPIFISSTVELIYNREENAWVFTCRKPQKKNEGIKMGDKKKRKCPECEIDMILIKQSQGTPTHYWKCLKCNKCQ